MTTEAGRILVLEDEIAILDLIVMTLERAGYVIDAAETVSDARDLLAAHPYDIFLTDLRVNGEYAGDLLRDEWDKIVAQGTQVVVLSAEEMYRSDISDIGVDFFLSKPFTGSVLRTLIERLMASAAQ